MRRHFRRAVLVAAITLGLGNSTCRVSSDTREDDDGQQDEDRFEAVLAVPFPGMPVLVPAIAARSPRR